jgi:hypothetical protein
VGILCHAWPKEQQEIEQTARRITRATYERLLTDNHIEQAEAFKKQVDEALVRDCVICVTWTGDADIDLMVEEPTGTVCSALNPRSTAGGVMLGDTYARLGNQAVGGYSEFYVCPQGFSGQYRLQIKRIWGKPTAGTVTVEVATNYGSDKQKIQAKHLQLRNDTALVVFDLAEGRRKEAVEAQQIAAVARIQEEFSRAILGQQLSAYESSDAVRDYLRYTLAAQRDGRLPRGRGVGVRPVITVLPEGTNFVSSAVISADRRYVRVTPSPLFSGIGEVSTFTFIGGGGQQGGGGGGLGGGGLGGGGGGLGGGGGGLF